MSVIFEVSFRPHHSNQAFNLRKDLTKKEARNFVAKLLKYNRKYGKAKVIELGCVYEISQPELNMIAYDNQGILYIDSFDYYDDDEKSFWDDYELLAS